MTVYACTFVEKTVEIDDFEKGCLGQRTCVIADAVNIRADSLQGLIDEIGNYFGLEMDDLFIPDPDQEGTNAIGFNRLEDEHGNEPTKAQQNRWKAGKLTLYLADYYFAIEKRTVEPVRLEEFEAAHITTH